MRLHYESYEKKAKRLAESKRKWSKWFAWYPVRIGDELVWLETVQRRIVWDRVDEVNLWLHKELGDDNQDSY